MPRPPKAGGAAFVPRSYTKNKKKFGHSSKPLTEKPVESPQHAAAELQHALATRIREYFLDENVTLAVFCRRTQLPTGLTYERFERILRGETMMALSDVMFWVCEIPDFATVLAEKVRELQVEAASAILPMSSEHDEAQ